MSSTNVANQKVTFSYGERAESKIFNSLNHGILPAGIYSGAALTRISNSAISISPGIFLLRDTSKAVTVRVETQDAYSFDNAAPAAPFATISLPWKESQTNYAEFHWRAVGGIEPDDIVLGKAVYSGSTLTGFDYTLRDGIELGSKSSLAWSSSSVYNNGDAVYYSRHWFFSKVDSNTGNTPPLPPTYETAEWINFFGPELVNTNYVSNSDTVNENLSALDGQVNTNAQDIQTNASDIATNTSDIATNEGNITTNSADLSSATDAATGNELVRRDSNANAAFNAVSEALLQFDTATTTSHTITDSGENYYSVDTSTADFTFTLPDLATNQGRKILLLNTVGPNDVIFNAAGTDTIGTVGAASGTITLADGAVQLIAVADYWVVNPVGGAGTIDGGLIS